MPGIVLGIVADAEMNKMQFSPYQGTYNLVNTQIVNMKTIFKGPKKYLRKKLKKIRRLRKTTPS